MATPSAGEWQHPVQGSDNTQYRGVTTPSTGEWRHPVQGSDNTQYRGVTTPSTGEWHSPASQHFLPDAVSRKSVMQKCCTSIQLRLTNTLRPVRRQPSLTDSLHAFRPVTANKKLPTFGPCEAWTYHGIIYCEFNHECGFRK